MVRISTFEGLAVKQLEVDEKNENADLIGMNTFDPKTLQTRKPETKLLTDNFTEKNFQSEASHKNSLFSMQSSDLSPEIQKSPEKVQKSERRSRIEQMVNARITMRSQRYLSASENASIDRTTSENNSEVTETVNFRYILSSSQGFHQRKNNFKDNSSKTTNLQLDKTYLNKVYNDFKDTTSQIAGRIEFSNASERRIKDCRPKMKPKVPMLDFDAKPVKNQYTQYNRYMTPSQGSIGAKYDKCKVYNFSTHYHIEK